MRSRVMPGSLVTIARRVPVKRLKSVDLPTLGRPTMTRDGSRSAMSSRAGHTTSAAAGCVIFQCSAFKAWLKVRGCGGAGDFKGRKGLIFFSGGYFLAYIIRSE